MHLGLSFRLTQIQVCVICGQSMAEHAESCPYNLAEAVASRKLDILCPTCHKGKVDLNTSDFYECRKCKSQFTHSPLYDDETKDRLIMMDWANDKTIICLQLPDKGKSQFKIDIELKKVDQIIKHARKHARKNKHAKNKGL